MRKCDKCDKEKDNVNFTCIINNGKTNIVYLCEKCYDKLEKPFKSKREI